MKRNPVVRRRKGRSRGKRGTWTTIRVRGYSYLRRVPRKKRRVRVHVSGYTYTRFFPSRRPKPPIPPKPYVEPIGWIKLTDYMERLREEVEDQDSKLIIQEHIYHTDQNKDSIETGYKFVFKKPIRMEDSPESMGGKVIPLVRVWFLLYNRKNKEHFIWARARSLRNPAKHRLSVRTLKGAYDHVTEMEAEAQESAKDFAYVEFQDIIAWTAWAVEPGEKLGKTVAPYKYKKRRGQRRRK